MYKPHISRIGTWFSLSIHIVLLSFLIFVRHETWKVEVPRTKGGQHTILYWQGATANTWTRTNKTAPVQKSDNSLLTRSQQKSVPASDSRPKQSVSANSLGGAETGSADITPAYPVIFPSPHFADRSLLPSESRNVVVDVNVSAQGDVLDERLVHGLGNNADQIVLDTVKSWKFHPASSNGSAVASVAELIVPLSPKWNG